MSLADNYPVGMSICNSYGIAGNCGYLCPNLASGECDSFEDFSPEEIQDSCRYHGYGEEAATETKKEIRRERLERKKHALSNP